MLKPVFVALAGRLIFQRPAEQKTFEQLIDDLAAGKQTVLQRLGRARDTPKQREYICHIIGIERWGQRRLQVALGAAPIQDEYDGYRPPNSLPWEEYAQQFDQTRQETIDIVRQIAAAPIDHTMLIRHNEFGPITIRGWVRYLNQHAALESYRFYG